MSYKSRLFPLSGTGETNWQLSIQGSWGSVSADSKDVQFLRSWLVYDSDILTNIADEPPSWNKLVGLGLSFVVSAGIWLGIGMTVMRLLK
ncbi:MAG: hypothetical protein JWQ87_1617 [Candidatus Sulfotelmatobacter sp.]|nr:hypothetical protein [Candidatus Sulfotelmatobacter sp.]